MSLPSALSSGSLGGALLFTRGRGWGCTQLLLFLRASPSHDRPTPSIRTTATLIIPQSAISIPETMTLVTIPFALSVAVSELATHRALEQTTQLSVLSRSSSASLAEQQQRSMSTPFERAAALADVHRASSFQSIRFEVSVAHTRSRFKARFCVAMEQPLHKAKWTFGVSIAEIKHLETQLRHLVKACNRGKRRQCTHDHTPCVMCRQLRDEIRNWPRFSTLSTIGKRHLHKKCLQLTRFFVRLLGLLHNNAQWLESCETLREILRMAEEVCRLRYENEKVAVEVLKSLPHVTQPLASEGEHDHDEEECVICLDQLYTSSRDPSMAVALPCGHRFHDTCLCLWFDARINCPICRTDAHPLSV